MEKKRSKVMFVAIFFLVILVIPIGLLSNPLRMPDRFVRYNLLRTLQLGTTFEDAIQIIEANENWQTITINRGRGFLMLHGRPSISSPSDRLGGYVVGEQFIRVHIGHYRYVFRRDVVAYLAFDADGYLIEIAVTRQIDAL